MHQQKPKGIIKLKKYFFCLLLLCIIVGCKQKSVNRLPYFNTADFTPVWIDKNSPQLTNLHTISPFLFTDQNGNTITKKTTNGKIFVANFFFTRCQNICPKMMDNLKKVAIAFKNDSKILIISHSVTPYFDNVEVLKKYATEKGITTKNWHLVTGKKEEIYKIARLGYFADTVTSSAISTQFLHTENFILVDKNGHIRGVYNGTIDFEVENLIRHIKLLELEN